MDFEAFGQPAGFGWREGFVERSQVVGVEVVHHQSHLCRLRIALLQHGLDEPRPILAGASFGDLNVAASGQRFDLHKERGDPEAHIFVIDDASVPRRGSNGRMHFAHQLFVGLIHAHDGKARIMR